ncbi:MAG TPA: hypothetical protein VNP04_13665 [Alphaproteobacteria bacterium]|nr:hypothetical protein [Alphaproteobacteria bacterium]
MGASAIIALSFPASLTVVNLKSQNVEVSSTSAMLAALQSFIVTTCSWTLIDTGVSGISENFVVRSSGASGDRIIVAKFGVSTATEAYVSVFACVSFASATDVASNPCEPTRLRTTSGGPLRLYMQGTRDFVFVGTNLTPASNQDSTWCYVGLVDEFYSSVSATPNRVVVFGSCSQASLLIGVGAMVEGGNGIFNVRVAVDATLGPDFTSLLGRSDPDQNTGRVFLWAPLVFDVDADRVYGWMRGVVGVGKNIPDGSEIFLSGQVFRVWGIGGDVGAHMAIPVSA